jgi:O-antigen/teichoic acid export membrane protein
MTPLIGLLIIAMPLVVRVMYTPAFMPIVMFASLMLLGMQFKAISWALGYVYLAKGNGRLFLILEIISGAIILGLNLVFYYFMGLNGLGISFILSYFAGMILAYSILRVKYEFGFPKEFYGKAIISFAFVAFIFSTLFIPVDLYKYLAGILVLLGATAYSLFKLNELLDLRSFISGTFKK